MGGELHVDRCGLQRRQHRPGSAVGIAQFDSDDLRLARTPPAALFTLDAFCLVTLALVGSDDLGGWTDHLHFALLDPGDVFTQLRHLAQPMADEDDGAPIAAELVDLLRAATLEGLVPTDKTSSMSKTSGSTFAATAKPNRTNIPDE